MDDTKIVFDEADKYKAYFSTDEARLDNIVKKLEDLEAIIDSQIEEMKKNLIGRGTQKYMIDHITNAISIQTEIQSLLKDKRSIKENSLNLALKSLKGQDTTTDSEEILAKLNLMIKTQSSKSEEVSNKIEKSLSDKELDDEIEKRLSQG